MNIPADPIGGLGGLSREDLANLRSLVSTWSLLADLSFSDLLLLASPRGSGTRALQVLAQVRPATSQTSLTEDLVGEAPPQALVDPTLRVLGDGQRQRGEFLLRQDSLRYSLIPVPSRSRLQSNIDPVAVLAVISPQRMARRRGELEEAYQHVASRLLAMIEEGSFPFPDDTVLATGAPRVGDGLIILKDPDSGVIAFASPNATSALHHLGITRNLKGQTIAELGLELDELLSNLRNGSPYMQEVTSEVGTTVTFTGVPLMERGSVTGGILLVRDVTELRRREREIISKQAALKEVHHRVKNNLQTISSLLRLQARRIKDPTARAALSEADRRIRSIAVVHELLSLESSELISVRAVLETLVRLLVESSVVSHPPEITYEGVATEVPADKATPLAIVVAELIQNALEHAFVEQLGRPPRVAVRGYQSDHRLRVEVEDNGVGLPASFDISNTNSLGLSLVKDLVTTQLQGVLELSSGPDGTTAVVDIPL
jgi:two-component sensor histidine kinase